MSKAGGKKRGAGGKSSRTPAVPAALLAAALRAQGEGVFIAARRCGPRGLKILFANDSLCAMIGYSPVPGGSMKMNLTAVRQPGFRIDAFSSADMDFYKRQAYTVTLSAFSQ